MKKILIVNQHGENRGDEAAMRAMLHGIEEQLGKCEFTMVCQFMNRDLTISFNEDVRIFPMLIPAHELPGLALYTLLKVARINAEFSLGKKSRQVICAYKQSDIVISAPGGPYFGDIYSGTLGYHELAHWFMIFLAKLHKKPAFLYAPSAGPFKKKWLNPVRRSLYRYFKAIAIREDISKSFVEDLVKNREVYLAADSALQKKIPPLSREQYFEGKVEQFKGKFLVSVSANDYKYPLSSDVEKNKKEYFECLRKLIIHIAACHDAHFIMYPQLYGGVHSDVPFLTRLGDSLPANVSWEIADASLNSDEQQAIWGMTDFTIASRYHPQIFSAIQCVPYLCIYYEHKQLGFVKALGLEEYAFDIYNVDADTIIPRLDKAIAQRVEISRVIGENIQPIVERARLSSKLVAQIINQE